jgi:all-trans-retinol dehydrogenase (NAD+)
MIYLTDRKLLGIHAECITHYAGGEGICTSTIHPSWHATGMLKGREEMLEKQGITLDAPSRVSEAVLEEVLRGRSGRVCVPGGGEATMGIVHWPRWVQDMLLGLIWRREGQFEFGKGLEFNIPR